MPKGFVRWQNLIGIGRDSVRLDQLIVERGLAPSKTKAQALIKQGCVQLKQPGKNQQEFKVITKSGFEVASPDQVELKVVPLPEQRFVSRSGLKLADALEDLELRVNGWSVLDVGQSTGGFTQALLNAGVEKVVGIDVGHDQLSAVLRADQRVQSFEGVNARNAEEIGQKTQLCENQMDMLVMDVSFISLEKVLPSVVLFLKPGGLLLSLVKPQFELDKSKLDKSGVVKDDKDYLVVQNNVIQWVEQAGLQVQKYFESSIRGGDGNLEFFVFAKKEK